MNTPPPAPLPSERVPWLDAARILATLLIVLFHIPSSPFGRIMAPESTSLVLSFFGSAAGALAFFFCTAGYLAMKVITGQQWSNKLLLLVLPYIVWNGICAFGLRDEPTLSRITGFGDPSGLCADYPLWFVRDLMVMLLFYPLCRRILPGMMIICLGFLAVCGTEWPWAWMRTIPIPQPGNWLLFFIGMIAARYPLGTWKTFFLWTLPLWWGTALLHLFGMLPTSPWQALLGACSIMSFGALSSVFLPNRWIPGITLVSRSTFLCYAAHAPVLIILGLLAEPHLPQFIRQSWIYAALPPLILALSTTGYQLMRCWLPSLLPLIAHGGQFPWQKRRSEIKES